MRDERDVGTHGEEVADCYGGQDGVDGRSHGATGQDDDVEGVGGDAERTDHQAQVPVDTPVPVASVTEAL